ncbi:ER membrane protein-like protein [Venustampulla echinocandica]|uniref:ER membrane protein-like protein n=1 Tax=Venustampulla echinocandica TaxID=2656787 RepID=A0A370TQY2_9HELO|nr:ER membrane protein-like protein [Venustampulla echinocandica]RDL37931.1 ER membrane protein-like protein [Venustampulla echinocandica]
MWIFRVLSSTIFLLSIILSIPISFDVGGRDCGLAFSLCLFLFYFFYSILKLDTPDNSRGRWALVQIIGMFQWILVPGLLIWSMNRFAVDANNSGDWVARTFSGKRAQNTSVKEWIFGSSGLLESMTVGTWYVVLRYSTPLFQLAEGFCSLLVIQAAGQITRWLVNRGRSDTWMIGLLVMSASIISSSVYFLWRITNFPEISNVDAILIGVSITCAVFLCAWGIGSGRGNPVESSLLFAYVVLCIYQIFTDYLPTSAEEAASPPAQPEFPPFPPIIMASYSTLVYILSTLPSAVHSGFTFLYAAFQTITPSIIISLAYRIFVFYAATRIIPAVRESGARALSQEPSLEDSDGAGKLLGLLSWFSPSILIAVYTSLLMQHFSTTSAEGNSAEWWTMQGGDTGGNIWRWVNVVGTMGLYALELYLGKEDMDGGLTGHWKTD